MKAEDEITKAKIYEAGLPAARPIFHQIAKSVSKEELMTAMQSLHKMDVKMSDHSGELKMVLVLHP